MTCQAPRGTRLTIGYIPLADAAALIVAADRGFAAAEGLQLDLVREVSWSNVRDKLNIGLLDGAHLLAPLAVASSLGSGHVKVPITVPFNLALNGNAITVAPALWGALADAADGDMASPAVTARALARVVALRKARGLAALTFGMTFPFSHHNYQLRFWMAAGGVVPDEDVQLVVLPPPYMAESLGNGHVDGFCVGAPWSSAAVDRGVGHILHFGSEIMARAAEKVLALRRDWAAGHPDAVARLVRALERAARFVAEPTHREEVAALVAAPARLNVSPEVIARTLEGRLVLTPAGSARASDRYLVIGRLGASRPDPVQAAWAYAQMVRWGQAPLSPETLAMATGVFRPDLYDAAVGGSAGRPAGEPADGIGAFAGPAFDPGGVAAHLAAWHSAP
jgi:NitT/TauT family transport system ATP-binding protein